MRNVRFLSNFSGFRCSMVSCELLTNSPTDLGKRWQEAPAVAPHMGWLLLSCVPIGLVSLVQALGWQSLIVRMAGRPLPAWLSMELFLASRSLEEPLEVRISIKIV